MINGINVEDNLREVENSGWSFGLPQKPSLRFPVQGLSEMQKSIQMSFAKWVANGKSYRLPDDGEFHNGHDDVPFDFVSPEELLTRYGNVMDWILQEMADEREMQESTGNKFNTFAEIFTMQIGKIALMTLQNELGKEINVAKIFNNSGFQQRMSRIVFAIFYKFGKYTPQEVYNEYAEVVSSPDPTTDDRPRHVRYNGFARFDTFRAEFTDELYDALQELGTIDADVWDESGCEAIITPVLRKIEPGLLMDASNEILYNTDFDFDESVEENVENLVEQIKESRKAEIDSEPFVWVKYFTPEEMYATDAEYYPDHDNRTAKFGKLSPLVKAIESLCQTEITVYIDNDEDMDIFTLQRQADGTVNYMPELDWEDSNPVENKAWFYAAIAEGVLYNEFNNGANILIKSPIPPACLENFEFKAFSVRMAAKKKLNLIPAKAGELYYYKDSEGKKAEYIVI